MFIIISVLIEGR